MESQEALGAATARLNHSQQADPHCKSYSLLSGLVEAFSMVEECVFLLLQDTRVCKSCFLESSKVQVQSSKLIVNDCCLPGVLDVL